MTDANVQELAGRESHRPYRAARRVMLAAACMCACGQLLELDDYETRDVDAAPAAGERCPRPDGECGGFPWPEPCAACVSRECCPEANACSAEPTCVATSCCTSACLPNDGTCIYGCLSEHGVGSQAAANLHGCQIEKCLEECVPNGWVGAGFGPQCANCGATLCAAESTEWLADPGGLDWIRCATGTCDTYTDPGCWLACDHAVGESARALRYAVGQCQFQRCRSECQAGGHVECLNDYKWPVPQAQTASLRLTVVGATEGLTVRACDAVSVDCGPAERSDEAVTDANGTVLLEGLPAGFDGYFDLSEVGATGLHPWIHYLGRPVIDSDFEGMTVLPVAVLENIEQGVGQTFDANRGHVVVFVQSCVTGWQVRCAVVEAVRSGSAPPMPSYLAGVFPSAADSCTTGMGGVVFLNLEPGYWTLIARLGETEYSRRVGIVVRAGVVTSVTMTPTPR